MIVVTLRANFGNCLSSTPLAPTYNDDMGTPLGKLESRGASDACCCSSDEDGPLGKILNRRQLDMNGPIAAQAVKHWNEDTV